MLEYSTKKKTRLKKYKKMNRNEQCINIYIKNYLKKMNTFQLFQPN